MTTPKPEPTASPSRLRQQNPQPSPSVVNEMTKILEKWEHKTGRRVTLDDLLGDYVKLKD